MPQFEIKFIDKQDPTRTWQTAFVTADTKEEAKAQQREGWDTKRFMITRTREVEAITLEVQDLVNHQEGVFDVENR